MARSLGWVACALVVIGCQGSKAGSATPDELARAAIERAGHGDVDGTMQLTGSPAIFDRAMECPGDRSDAMRTKMAAAAHDEIARDVAAWKGVTASVVAVQPNGDPVAIKAGQTFSGCAVKVDLTTQRFAVTVRGNRAGDPQRVGEIELTAIEVGGRWYLESLAAPARGDAAKLEKMKNAMCACKDAVCVEKVQQDYADFARALDEKYTGDLQPDEAMVKIREEMAKCMSDATAYRPAP